VINPGPVRGLDEPSAQDEEALASETAEYMEQLKAAEYRSQDQGTEQLSEEEVNALEDLIVDSDFEID